MPTRSHRLTYNDSGLFKALVFILDVAIHFSIFLLVRAIFEAHDEINILGTMFILISSYIGAILIVPIQLTDRFIGKGTVASRAVYQTAFFTLLFAMSMAIIYDKLSIPGAIVHLVLSGITITSMHIAIRYLISKARSKENNILDVVFIGADPHVIDVHNTLAKGLGAHGFRMKGFFTSRNEESVPDGVPIIGTPSQAVEWLHGRPCDIVYCSVSALDDKNLVREIYRVCEENLIRLFYVPELTRYFKGAREYSMVGDVPVIGMRKEPLSIPANYYLKRTCDVLVSGLFLVTIYPFVWLFVAIGTRLSSPGPILFRQERTGYNGQTFTMFKFRSMKVNADADKLQATADDPRKTRFGDFLRRTSIDELPQFINIFKGDMSLIGPRPHMVYHTEKYSELISNYMVRHLCRPGLSGWAQVSGCRGETETVEQMARRVKYDIWYIEHWTPILDLRIVFRTLKQLVAGDKQAY